VKIIDDRGSALIDFLGFGLLLQIPLLLLSTQLAAIQSMQLAADSIARHSLRSYVLQGKEPQETALQIANDFHLSGDPKIELICEPDCISPFSVLRLNVLIGSVKSSSVMIR
jgi:hypothetical protein